MITKGTNLLVADNSGGKKVACIDIRGSSKQKYTRWGKVILVVAKKIKSNKKVIRKKKYKALIISTAANKRRNRGYFIKSDANRVLLFTEQTNKFLGTRVYGSVCKEARIGKTETLYKQVYSYSRRIH